MHLTTILEELLELRRFLINFSIFLMELSLETKLFLLEYCSIDTITRGVQGVAVQEVI